MLSDGSAVLRSCIFAKIIKIGNLFRRRGTFLIVSEVGKSQETAFPHFLLKKETMEIFGSIGDDYFTLLYGKTYKNRKRMICSRLEINWAGRIEHETC